jgi:TonB family protein
MKIFRYHVALLTFWAIVFFIQTIGAAAMNSNGFAQREEPEFPSTLAMTSILDGYAVLVFTVDADGKRDDAFIHSASHAAFGESVLVAARNWSGVASVDTTAPMVSRREVVRYEFRRSGAVVSLTHRDSFEAVFSPSSENKAAIRTVAWSELAEPPARISSANPKYPAALRAQRPAGTAVVSFIIDTSGAVRVPAVIAADRAEFGAAALEAVKQWRFESPQLEGTPVNVEVERRFFFGPAAR